MQTPVYRLLFVSLLVLALAPTNLFAQLTARQLVYSSMGRFGPEFKDVEQAVVEFKKRNFDLSQGLLERARKKHEQLAPADTMMALLHLSTGNVALARRSIDRAITREPKDPEAFNILGDLWLRKKELVGASLAYDRGLKLIDDQELTTFRKSRLQRQAYAGLASVGEGSGQYLDALNYLKKWQSLDPKNLTCIGSLGRVSFFAQQYDKAREYFSTLYEMEKSAPSPDIAMAGLYADLGMNERAQKEFEAAIAKNKKDIRTRITVAEWAINTGKYDLAKDNITAALDIEPTSATSQLLSARLARQKEDLETAEKILSQAILKNPNLFTISNELARTLANHPEESKKRTGLDYARRNFQLYGKQKTRVGTEALFTFAWLLHQNGKNESAIATLNGLPGGTAIGNENAYYAAVIYSKISRKTVAISALQAALKNANRFPNRSRAEQLLKQLKQSSTPGKESRSKKAK